MSCKAAEQQLEKFEACLLSGDTGRSFSHLSLALYLQPQLKHQYYSTYLEIFEKWSNKVDETQGLSEVMTLFEVALNHYPQSPDLHHLLAVVLYRHGSLHEAWNHACVAHTECPRDPRAQDTQDRLANALVDRWHLPMLNDVNRNSAFKQAIERAVRRGHHSVLDIGSGTGLLSIFAQNAGAQDVYACEVDKFMCEVGSSVLRINLDSPNINILNKHSKDIGIPTDIPQKVSLVVSETMDAGLFGEHILSTLHHAWKHLLLPPERLQETKTQSSAMPSQTLAAALPSDGSEITQMNSPQVSMLKQNPLSENTPENLILGCNEIPKTGLNEVNGKGESNASATLGRVIPSRAEVFFALVRCEYIARQTKVSLSNVQCLKNKNVSVRLQEPYMSEKLNCVPGGFKLLSEWTRVTDINFNSLKSISQHLTGEVDKRVTLKCIETGYVDALVLAFNLYLDEINCIRTFPDSSIQTVWENAVYPVTHPLSVIPQDLLTVEFLCSGIINLAIQDRTPTNTDRGNVVNLSTTAIKFLNSKNFVDTFSSVAQQIFNKLQQIARRDAHSHNHPLIICDALPFPVAGLCLQTLWPDSQLYVEDVSIQKVLQELGISAGLCEELEEDTVDVLFLWPVTQEGTFIDGILENTLMYRMMMREGGVVFPEEVDLVLDVVSSPALLTASRVSDTNTCEVKVAQVLNMMQTSHQLDVALSSLPDTKSAVAHAIPVLRLSLASGCVQPLTMAEEDSVNRNPSEGLLVLGGEVVEVLRHLTVTHTTTLTALPYWFHLKGSWAQASSSTVPLHSGGGIVLSTGDADSPCNQSVLILRQPVAVTAGERVSLEVVWRGGVFTATLQQSTERAAQT